MEPHYFFPPAKSYALNRCLFLLKSDDDFRRRFLADRDAALAELDLDAASRAALATLDRDRLVGLGAHPYLAFMAALRIRMEREPAAFELF